jgi:hypothetical protein
LLLASWNLVGYGLSQISPKPIGSEGVTSAVEAFSKTASEISNEEAIEALESLLPKGDTSEEARKLPWSKIISVAVKIIVGILLI